MAAEPASVLLRARLAGWVAGLRLRTGRWQRLSVHLFAWLGLWAAAAVGAAPVVSTALAVPANAQRIELWPQVRVLFETRGQPLALEDVQRRRADFRTPDTPYANLGTQPEAVWLWVPLAAAPGAVPAWLLDIDHPALDLIDVYLVGTSGPPQHHRLGDTLPFSSRPLPMRSLVAPLTLRPGEQQELFVRLRSGSTLLAPLVLVQPLAYQAQENRFQLMQGLLTGAALCLILYSLAQAAVRREAAFVYYALALTGTTGFFFTFYGFGPQYLWRDVDWIVQGAPILFGYIGLTGTFLFAERTLRVGELRPRTARAMKGLAGASLLLAALFALGWLPYVVAHKLCTLLGTVPMLLALPVALQRARQGDLAATFVLFGWTVYTLGVATIVVLLRGLVDVSAFTLHAFQATAVVEMLSWMAALGARWQQIQQAAMRLQAERQQMEALAYADPLTGMLNRRGLLAQGALHVRKANRQFPAAVFLLDLDGFKAVNDTYGHDKGDDLLRAVAARLQSRLRAGDVVARLGGDEFVVIASRLQNEAAAGRIASGLLEALGPPLLPELGHGTVGVSIGYALAPADSQDLQTLLRQADAAMYAAKHGGKGCARRWLAAPAADAGPPAQAPAATKLAAQAEA